MTETALTLLTAPAILALVNLFKGLGLGGRWPALVAVLLGVLIACIEHYAPADAVQTVSAGLVVGLGAAGLYDVGKTTITRSGEARRAIQEPPMS